MEESVHGCCRIGQVDTDGCVGFNHQTQTGNGALLSLSSSLSNKSILATTFAHALPVALLISASTKCSIRNIVLSTGNHAKCIDLHAYNSIYILSVARAHPQPHTTHPLASVFVGELMACNSAWSLLNILRDGLFVAGFCANNPDFFSSFFNIYIYLYTFSFKILKSGRNIIYYGCCYYYHYGVIII